MKYLVHFITNEKAQLGENRYANAVITAPTKEQAIKQASFRPHFKEAFLVVVKHHSRIEKVIDAMVAKYGHHNGIHDVRKETA